MVSVFGRPNVPCVDIADAHVEDADNDNMDLYVRDAEIGDEYIPLVHEIGIQWTNKIEISLLALEEMQGDESFTQVEDGRIDKIEDVLVDILKEFLGDQTRS
ncbi:hypothetical protein GOP47_0028999 [Adiantum capillus-veneris]|nr:hypothetical protein GOP47_0028999 [Adiantum capillus-veneris]